MTATHIIIRIPGFQAAVEKRFLDLPEERPVAVCVGDDSRALILSACPRAAALGAKPGRRRQDIPEDAVSCVQASPERYDHALEQARSTLAESLPDVTVLRTGVFHAVWSEGRRFFDTALVDARGRVQDLGYLAGWGVSRAEAAAEIAATLAGAHGLVQVPDGGVPEFLSPLSLRLLHDLDTAQRNALAAMGIHTFGDVVSLPESVLRQLLGPEGPWLRRIALTGRRPTFDRQWRDMRRLAGDVSRPEEVGVAVRDLTAEAYRTLLARGMEPGPMDLSLVYADGRTAHGRTRVGRDGHEGEWQAALQSLGHTIWRRRVRVSSVRLIVTYGPTRSGQLSLLAPVHRQHRELRLGHAVADVRAKWGKDTVHFGSGQAAGGGAA